MKTRSRLKSSVGSSSTKRLGTSKSKLVSLSKTVATPKPKPVSLSTTATPKSKPVSLSTTTAPKPKPVSCSKTLATPQPKPVSSSKSLQNLNQNSSRASNILHGCSVVLEKIHVPKVVTASNTLQAPKVVTVSKTLQAPKVVTASKTSQAPKVVTVSKTLQPLKSVSSSKTVQNINQNKSCSVVLEKLKLPKAVTSSTTLSTQKPVTSSKPTEAHKSGSSSQTLDTPKLVSLLVKNHCIFCLSTKTGTSYTINPASRQETDGYELLRRYYGIKTAESLNDIFDAVVYTNKILLTAEFPAPLLCSKCVDKLRELDEMHYKLEAIQQEILQNIRSTCKMIRTNSTKSPQRSSSFPFRKEMKMSEPRQQFESDVLIRCNNDKGNAQAVSGILDDFYQTLMEETQDSISIPLEHLDQISTYSPTPSISSESDEDIHDDIMEDGHDYEEPISSASHTSDNDNLPAARTSNESDIEDDVPASREYTILIKKIKVEEYDHVDEDIVEISSREGPDSQNAGNNNVDIKIECDTLKPVTPTTTALVQPPSKASEIPPTTVQTPSIANEAQTTSTKCPQMLLSKAQTQSVTVQIPTKPNAVQKPVMIVTPTPSKPNATLTPSNAVQTPLVTAQNPVASVETPQTPSNAVQTPLATAQTPIASVETPQTLSNAVQTPLVTVQKPVASVETPQTPSSAVQKPVATVETPQTPSSAVQMPPATVQEPVVSVDTPQIPSNAVQMPSTTVQVSKSNTVQTPSGIVKAPVTTTQLPSTTLKPPSNGKEIVAPTLLPFPKPVPQSSQQCIKPAPPPENMSVLKSSKPYVVVVERCSTGINISVPKDEKNKKSDDKLAGKNNTNTSGVNSNSVKPNLKRKISESDESETVACSGASPAKSVALSKSPSKSNEDETASCTGDPGSPDVVVIETDDNPIVSTSKSAVTKSSSFASEVGSESDSDSSSDSESGSGSSSTSSGDSEDSSSDDSSSEEDAEKTKDKPKTRIPGPRDAGFIGPRNAPNWMRERKNGLPKPFKCSECDYECCNLSRFRPHMMKCHGIEVKPKFNRRKYICDICSYSRAGERITGFLMHLQSHETSVKSRTCNDCLRNFTTKQLYQLHVCSRTGLTKDEPTPSDLDKHNELVCRFCTLLCRSLRMLTKHTETEHPGNPPFVCPICQEGFKIKDNLLIHKIAKHDAVKLKCRICEPAEEFVNPHELFVHVNMKHHGLGLKCPYCPKTFLDRGKWRDHQVLHTKERNYICEYCPNTYSTPRTLKTHLKSAHSGDKNQRKHICEYCSNTYSQRSYLRRHIKAKHAVSDS